MSGILSFLIYVVLIYLLAQLLNYWLIDVLPAGLKKNSLLISLTLATIGIYWLSPIIKSVVIAPITSLFTSGS